MAIKRADFPLPDLDDPLTKEFFAGAARNELLIPRCVHCDRWVWYPQETCPACDGALAWTETSGRGRLFSWAVVHRPFLPAFAEMVRDAVRQFVEAEVRPQREELEFGDTPPYEVIRKLYKTFGMDTMARDG